MKTKQQKLEGNHGVFWRIRVSKGNLGKHQTDEAKQKMSDSHLGKNHTEESKQKIRETLTGKPKTELHKQHIKDNHADFSGEKHPMYGMKRPKHSQRMKGEKNPMHGADRSGEKNPTWKGGPHEARVRREEKRRGFGFIPLNKKFPGAAAHHLDTHFVLYIPSELHRSIYHNVMTGQGMKEINDLAIRYTYGEHEESRW